jgi:hypothetical protein
MSSSSAKRAIMTSLRISLKVSSIGAAGFIEKVIDKKKEYSEWHYFPGALFAKYKLQMFELNETEKTGKQFAEIIKPKLFFVISLKCLRHLVRSSIFFIIRAFIALKNLF